MSLDGAIGVIGKIMGLRTLAGAVLAIVLSGGVWAMNGQFRQDTEILRNKATSEANAKAVNSIIVTQAKITDKLEKINSDGTSAMKALRELLDERGEVDKQAREDEKERYNLILRKLERIEARMSNNGP